MERDSYREKIAYFDGQVHAPWSNREYHEAERQKLERVFGYIGSLDRLKILEPGCGTGRLTEILSDQIGPSGKVVALDISPKMVEAARKRLDGRANVEVVLAAVEDRPWGEELFDLVFCHQVFPHFEDKQKVLNLLTQGLKPGGKLIVFHFIHLARINDRHRKAGTAVERDLMPPVGEMKRMFQKAGLLIERLFDDEGGYFLGAKKASSRLP